MLINKIQEPEDIEVLSELPKGRVDSILKDTPEYLLEIMAKLYRALLYNMGVSEEETEKAAATIKERKMAKLFENVPKNFQADRKRAEKAERKLGKIQEELDEAEKELNEAEKELEICKFIIKMQKDQKPEQAIISSLMQKFYLTKEQASSELEKVFGE